MVIIRICKACSIFVMGLYLLTACDSNTDLIGNGDNSGTFSGDFMVVQAIDGSGNASFPSNEFPVSSVAAGLSISWTEPTRKIGDACLNPGTILSYRIGISNQRGSYDFLEGSQITQFGMLDCDNPSGNNDSFCSVPITTCSYTFTSAP